MAINPRHDTQLIDMQKAIDGDSKRVAIRSGYAYDMENARVEGGIIEKRSGYESVASFPIEASTSGATLTFNSFFWKEIGYTINPADATNVRDILGINGESYSGFYILRPAENPPEDTHYMSGYRFVKYSEGIYLCDQNITEFELTVKTGPRLPSKRLTDYIVTNEGGFLVIEADELAGMQVNTMLSFAINYFGTLSGKITAISGNKITLNISYASTTLPVVEFYYCEPNTPLFLQYYTHANIYSHVMVSGVTGPYTLTMNTSGPSNSGCSCFGIRDPRAYTHFISQFEGTMVLGHNNRLYTLDPNNSKLFKLPAYLTLNNSTVTYSADTNYLISVPTSVMPTTNLFEGCSLRFTGVSEFSGVVQSVSPSIVIKINQSYWEIPARAKIEVTYPDKLPHIADVKRGDCLKIGEHFYRVTEALPFIQLNKPVEVSTSDEIYFIARMALHSYSKQNLLNPVWFYGLEAPLPTTIFSNGLYIACNEGGVLRYDGKDVTNLTEFKAPTLPLVRSILGTHGSLEVESDAVGKDGYANEQQIIITYVIEEWTGTRMESMPTPHYDCIVRPALNPDGSMYASWLELAVPTLPSNVTTCKSVKIRVYRRDYVYSSGTIAELEVEVDNDPSLPYTRILIGNKFNFSQSVKKQLYADLFRFSHVPTPRASGICTFGNSLFTYNTITEPMIEIIGKKVFDFETKQGATFVGGFRFQTPDYYYRTLALGKDTTTASHGYVHNVKTFGNTQRTITQIACYAPTFILYSTGGGQTFARGDKVVVRYSGRPFSELASILSEPSIIYSVDQYGFSKVLSHSTRIKGVLPSELTSGALTGFLPFKKMFDLGEQQLLPTKGGARIYVSEGTLYLATEESGSLNSYFALFTSYKVLLCLLFVNSKDDTFANIRRSGSAEVLRWSTDLVAEVTRTSTSAVYLDGYKYNLRVISLWDSTMQKIESYQASEVAHTSATLSHGPFAMYVAHWETGGLGDGFHKITVTDNTDREKAVLTLDSSSGISVGDYVSLAWTQSGSPVDPSAVNLPEGFPSLRGSFKVTNVVSNQVWLDVIQVPDTVSIPFTGSISTSPNYQGLVPYAYKPIEIVNKVNATTLRVYTTTNYSSDMLNRITFMINRNAEYESVDMQLSGYYKVKGGGTGYVDLEYTDTIDLSTLSGFRYGRLFTSREANTLLIPVPVKNDITERLTDLAFPLFSLRSDEAYTGLSILSRLAYAINAWEHDKYVAYWGSAIAGGTSPYPAVGIQIQYRGYPISRTSNTTYGDGQFPLFHMTEANSEAYDIFSSVDGSISSKSVGAFGFSPFSIAESSRLWWTEKAKIVDKESFLPLHNNLNYQDIFSNEADRLVAVAPLKDSGLIFKEKSVYRMSLLPNQQGTITLNIVRIEAPTGTLQPFNIASAGSFVYYISAGSGIYSCDGEKVEPLPMNVYFDRVVGSDNYYQYAFCDPFEETIFLGYADKEGKLKRFSLGYGAGTLVTDSLPQIPRGYVKFENSHLLATDTGVWISNHNCWDDDGEAITFMVSTPYVSPDPLKHSFYRSIITSTYSDVTYSYDQTVYYSYGSTGEQMVKQTIPVMASGKQEFGGTLWQYSRQGSVVPRNSSLRLVVTESSQNIFQLHNVGVVFQLGNTSRVKQEGGVSGRRY